jgi:hypothetical protein
VSSAETDRCPDPDSNGQPCGPECPCACCPGHSSAVAFLSGWPSLGAPSSHENRASSPDDLHPKDVRVRIFHPPRA